MEEELLMIVVDFWSENDLLLTKVLGSRLFGNLINSFLFAKSRHCLSFYEILFIYEIKKEREKNLRLTWNFGLLRSNLLISEKFDWVWGLGLGILIFGINSDFS